MRPVASAAHVRRLYSAQPKIGAPAFMGYRNNDDGFIGNAINDMVREAMDGAASNALSNFRRSIGKRDYSIPYLLYLYKEFAP